jgi:hypothetical protein
MGQKLCCMRSGHRLWYGYSRAERSNCSTRIRAGGRIRRVERGGGICRQNRQMLAVALYSGGIGKEKLRRVLSTRLSGEGEAFPRVTPPPPCRLIPSFAATE